MFLTMGVLDSNKQYIGKLTLQLDFDAWLTNLKSKANTTGLIILLADQNNELLLTTDQNINFSPSLIPLNKADKQYSQLSQVVDEGSFTLTHYLTLQPYDYVLFYGYNKQYIYEYTIKRFIPLLLILWGALLIFITSQLFFSKNYSNYFSKLYSRSTRQIRVVYD